MSNERLASEDHPLFNENSATIASRLNAKLNHLESSSLIEGLMPVYDIPDQEQHIKLRDIYIMTTSRPRSSRKNNWSTSIIPAFYTTDNAQVGISGSENALLERVNQLRYEGNEVLPNIYIPRTQSIQRDKMSQVVANDYIICYHPRQEGFREGVLCIPAGVCLGLGMGFATGNIGEWIFFGLGSGFVGLIISSYLETRNQSNRR